MTNLEPGGAMFGLALIFGLLVLAAIYYSPSKGPTGTPTPPLPVEIARIEERVAFSSGGTVAVVLLVLHQIAMLAWVAAAKSAVQEASVGTVWIAGNILWGIGAIIGRRRTYYVLRSHLPAEKPESRT